MLKIKDNVDLKELEKYGFKKQYDKDTGKLTHYQHKEFEFVYVYLKDYKLNLASDLFNENEYEYIQKLLYDLITDGLVEKIDN